MHFHDFLVQKNKLLSNNILPDRFLLADKREFGWVWLPDADPQRVLDMRNSEHVTSQMKDQKQISLKQHVSFINNYKSLPRIDCVCYHHPLDVYVGCMYLTQTEYGLEYGKYIGNKDFLGFGIAHPMSFNFIAYLRKHMINDAPIYSRTKITNFKNINLNFRLGFKINKLVDEQYWLMEHI